MSEYLSLYHCKNLITHQEASLQRHSKEVQILLSVYSIPNDKADTPENGYHSESDTYASISLHFRCERFLAWKEYLMTVKLCSAKEAQIYVLSSRAETWIFCLKAFVVAS